jgi:hypothetical protein
VVRKKLKKSAAAPWIIGTIGMFASATASASSYAESADSINNFSITGIPTSSFGGFTFSGDFALSLGALPGIEAHLSTQDAAPACLGSYCSGFNNSFSSHGVSPSPGYAYGDAKIYSTNVLGGAGAASTIGETTIYDGAAGTSSANAMHAAFSLGDASTVNFSFNALPFMSTQLMSGGTGASGVIGMGITIKQSGTTVFQWLPNGASGGILNGTEVSDPFSLNSTIGSNLVYNPGSGFFSASTGLSAGNYTLDIAMANAVTATSTTVVPVPAALPLFGSGMAALAVLAKRRKRIQA